MRKIIILFLLCCLVNTAFSQIWKPVLSDGKEWRYATVNKYHRTDTTGYYKIMIVGDTIINNYVCKKILVHDEDKLYPNKTCVAYEENGKLYKVKDGIFTLIFDINLQKGDKIDNLAYVFAQGIVYINELPHKILYIDSMVDHPAHECFYKIIEGIGISKDEFISSFNLGSEKDYCTLISCKENGKIIYENTHNIETGIIEPTITTKMDNVFYNLNGIRVINPQKGNLYIHNRKKIIHIN